MDPDHLQQLAWQAGFRVDWDALFGLAARHPDQVLDRVCAAAEYAAADTGHRLLTATTAALRDLVAATEPGQLYQYADQLSQVCELLTQAEQARGDAIAQLSTRCLELATMDPQAFIPDPDGPAGPAPSTWPTATARQAAAPVRLTACRGLLAHPRRRPRRHQPPTT
jgi:hypothetical protein